MKKWPFFVVLILLFSCTGIDEENPEIPPFVLKEKQLVEVLVDMHLIKAASDQNLIPTKMDNLSRNQQFKGVFQKHGIQKEAFDSTISFYTNHPAAYKKIYAKVVFKIDSLKTVYGDN